MTAMEPRLKAGDRIRIVRNDIQPVFVGKVGRIKKVYESFSDECECRFLYRVEVDGETLKGVAASQDLEKV